MTQDTAACHRKDAARPRAPPGLAVDLRSMTIILSHQREDSETHGRPRDALQLESAAHGHLSGSTRQEVDPELSLRETLRGLRRREPKDGSVRDLSPCALAMACKRVL